MNHSLLMNARKGLVATILFLCSLTAMTQAQYANGAKKGMVKVKFTPTMTTSLSQIQANARTKPSSLGLASFDAVATNAKATNMYRMFPFDEKNESKLRKHGLHLWYIVEIDETVDPKTAAAQFKQLKEVAVAEVEREKTLAPYTVKPHTPGVSTFSTLPFNDPLLADQWHYNNTSQTGFGDADINLFEAWTKTTGANNIVVSVHDEGVDVNHADLKANIWVNTTEKNGQVGVDDDGNGFVDDINGFNFAKNKGAVDPQYHGTHVAGTIAAVNNNGIGVAGVAGGNGSGNGVKVMSLQILGGTSSSIERSYIYAADNGAVISQNSWGYTSPGAIDQSVLDAIDYFIAEAGDYPGSPMKGGIVIFAAGNSNYDADWYPGYYENVLTVTALGPEWKKTSYSNFGTWTDIAAPGGEANYGIKNSILSTIPGDKYAYMDGTSMACPHVSGVAALALANRTKQLSNTELWTKLLTGVVNIDEQNPDYLGKLGTGAIDANLAIRNDQALAPAAITNVSVTGLAQEFATLSWTVPADTDDDRPATFNLYYHTESITTSNLGAATKITLPNVKAAGSSISYEVTGLLGVTTYYFAITSTDRWGNTSNLSNIASGTTNEGPVLVLDANSQEINLAIDVTAGTTASHDITISNEAAGILRWSHVMRHRNTSLSYAVTSLHYPIAAQTKNAKDGNIAMRSAIVSKDQLKSNEATAFAFTTVEKAYSYWPTNIIGDTDTKLTNSAAAKFYVNEAEGFNLTDIQMYLKHDPAKGPVIVEVYEGSKPEKKNLVYAQEHNNWSTTEAYAYISLSEQLYFESGSTFWVVSHVPAGNLFPLGIGYETEPSYSDNCFMSFDLGGSWTPLENLISSNEFAWAITASSYNAHLGTYLTLEPGAGDVNGNEQVNTTLTANGATLINGDYNAYLIIKSNDAANQELRVPVTVSVSGHTPNLKHIDLADYGSVFIGDSKTLEFVIENQGYGNFNDPIISTGTSSFVVDPNTPWQIKAREEVVVKVAFKPSAAGNTNDILTITNGVQTYEIALFGVGAETAKIAIAPESQIVNNLAIGDEVTAQITVENTGAFPLKYFIPGHDTKGISNNWPSDYHSYGYTFRSNYVSETNPISYDFQDISGTGVNITQSLLDDGAYFTLDMGFQFPYYGQLMETLYIANKGFTTFDNSVRPINTPRLNDSWGPKGYVSILGTYLSYISSGEIFYQVESDRVIVQYDNVWDGWSFGETVTAQIVYYANGDIRFFYDEMNMSDFNKQFLSILIEDLAQTDGILINNYEQPTELYSGLAIGLDYPGPDIISNITNGSGILMPGASAVVEMTLSTTALVEGTTNRYINIINNDPENRQKNALVQLEITSGGTAMPVLSADTVRFGNVFQGAIRNFPFTLKNPGTANVDIIGMHFADAAFTFTGDQPTLIKPGLYKKYEIQVPTATLADLEDWLSIDYADGSHDTIYVTAKVVDAPAINVDLTPLVETLAYGEKSTHALSIENTGLANLEVAPVGGQWLSFSSATAPSNTVNDFSYTYEKHNNGDFYQWIDIRETGTQMEFVDYENFEGTFWRELELPFPIEFYGQLYNSFKIGDNGLISFEEEPAASLFTDYIPSTMHPGACIMPYWTFSSFSDMFHPKEEIGIFYQFYDDKIIITWSIFTNNFGGMGDPVSAQVIFYKNGSMKFQYKREDGGVDLTSQNSTIGLQRNSTEGLAISQYAPLDHGDGLAYIVTPSRRYTVTPGSTLSGTITLDATNIYGGVYTQALKIHSNAPNNELLKKPVELTVTGDANLVLADSVNFGSKQVAFESINPVTNFMDVVFENTGAASMDITYATLIDGTTPLNLMMLVQDFWGPMWIPINEIWFWPTFTIKPGDKLVARAIFAPIEEGEHADEVILTTSLGEKRFVLTGKAYEPANIGVDTASMHVSLNLPTAIETRSIAFDNVEGKSNLNYSVRIDFGRTDETEVTEKIATTTSSSLPLRSVTPGNGTTAVAKASAVYNRTLRHSDKDVPDTFLGTGGTSPFTLSTKFNAGSEGFNLSHIETFFRVEEVSTAVIEVEIRAGGNSVADATTLTQGTLTVTSEEADGAGAWYQITLEETAGIYPNEDFYVIVTYPLGIEYPQGAVTDAETVPGRYSYLYQGQWYEVQEGEFSNVGWLMLAAEAVPGNFTWLKITSAEEGVLPKGEAGAVSLSVEAAYASPGNQVAHIVFESNDPAEPIVRVPLTLHINEAPYFIDAPVSIVIAENEEVSVDISVVDPEENAITLSIVQAHENVSYNYTNGVVELVFTPQFGDEGTFTYTLQATDEYGAKTELSIPVEFVHTNRPPAYIGAEDGFTFHTSSNLEEYSIADYFADPDGDDFTYSISSSNELIVTAFASSNKFLVKTTGIGTETLTFTLTDSHGAVTEASVPVKVDLVDGLEDQDINFSVLAYPNPTTGQVRVQVNGEISRSFSVEVMNTLGATVWMKENCNSAEETVLDLSALPKGVYLLSVSDQKGKSIRRIVKE